MEISFLPLYLHDLKIKTAYVLRRIAAVVVQPPSDRFSKTAYHVIHNIILRNTSVRPLPRAAEQFFQVFFEKTHKNVITFAGKDAGQIIHMLLQMVKNMFDDCPCIVVP